MDCYWVLRFFNNGFLINFAILTGLNISSGGYREWVFPNSFNVPVSIVCTGIDVSGVNISGYLIQNIVTTSCRIAFWADNNTAKFNSCSVVALGY